MPKILKHADYAESWYRVYCPYCETDNWYSNGDESDLSGLDIEAVKCRSCNNVFRIGPPDSIMDELRDDDRDDYGLETTDGINLLKEL